ncbi:MAG: PASTA domain-containing protein [Bacteroides sp.]|nr:PASTA domain-containing protein [Bacteroides sp.]
MLKKIKPKAGKGSFIAKHPVLANIIVICLVAILGIWIVYLSLKLFTRHGSSDTVPKVENMSYTQAIKTLHDKGFRVDIRDSIYKEDMKPGYVIEQFPKAGATVKPGRKIFLYINAVHVKEVVIDQDNNPREDALKSFSFRQGMARLEELGFKNIRVVRVLGNNDCIVKITANGKVVKKTEKVPVNAQIVVEVYDGRLGELRDSLQLEEYRQYQTENAGESTGTSDYDEPAPKPAAEPDAEEVDEDEMEVEPAFIQ